jgi:type II secretion system protein H
MGTRTPNRGFTLIELLAVMALLTTIMAIVAPSLSRFMRGRDVEEEARRFLALTRYARSEAVSRSVMLRLWVDPEEGRYGLEPETRAASEDVRVVEYTLANRLHFALPEGEVIDGETGRLDVIFWPDGITDEAAAREIRILEEDNRGFAIIKQDFGLGYAIEECYGDA